MKLYAKVMIISLCFLLVLTGCSKEEDNNSKWQQVDEVENQAGTQLEMNDLGKTVMQVGINNRNLLWFAPIFDDGSILTQELTYTETNLYLFNVETKEELHLNTLTFDNIDSQRVYAYAYQDDEIIVYYDYTLQNLGQTPNKYYLYHRNTMETEVIDYQEKIEVSNTSSSFDCNYEMSRIKQLLFFNVEEGESYRIYQYNIDTKEISFVSDGRQPRQYQDELLFINQDNNLISLAGTILNNNVVNYAVYEDTMVIVKEDRDNDQNYAVLLIENEVEIKLFTKLKKEMLSNITCNKEFVSWENLGNETYMYHISKLELLQIKSDEPASIKVVISDDYVYWADTISNSKDKNGGTIILNYFKLD